MGTKQIRVSERLYARVKAEKREDETIGEALERMVGRYDLLDFTAEAQGTESLDVGAIEQAMEDASERNAAEVQEALDMG